MKHKSLDVNKEYEEAIKKNTIVKHSVNGLSRFLILWIIKHNESIHGYAIMKELDKFFVHLIKDGALKKSNPSKIYPILRKMEEANAIEGKWVEHENQKVKYYSLTEKGAFLINYFTTKMAIIMKNESWQLLFEDIF